MNTGDSRREADVPAGRARSAHDAENRRAMGSGSIIDGAGERLTDAMGDRLSCSRVQPCSTSTKC